MANGMNYEKIDMNISNVSSLTYHFVGGDVGPDDLNTITEDVYHYAIVVICCLGTIGIVMTTVVLGQKNMCTSTNCYLMALSIADLFVLFLFLSILMLGYFESDTKAHRYYQIFATYALIFLHIFFMSSIWMTVLLAVERYIAICQPYLAARLCTVRRARFLTAAIFLTALLVRLPHFWEHKIVVIPIHENFTLTFVDSTDFVEDKHYRIVYPWVVDIFLCSFAPFSLLVILNARLVWEVRRSTKYLQRGAMISSSAANIVQREEVQITIMLISIVIIFFICQGPYVVYTALTSLPNMPIHTSGFNNFKMIASLLVTLKSTINFIVYCWFSEKFWLTLNRLCRTWLACAKKRKKRNGISHSSYYPMRTIATNVAPVRDCM